LGDHDRLDIETIAQLANARGDLVEHDCGRRRRAHEFEKESDIIFQIFELQIGE
jgi:hypothetical protein